MPGRYAAGSPTSRIAPARLLRTKRCCTRCRVASTRRGRSKPKPIRSSRTSAAPWSSAIAAFGRWALELLAGAPRARQAAARACLDLFKAMGATGNGSTAAALWPLRLSDKAVTKRPSATPTSPQHGQRPTTPHRSAPARRPRTRTRSGVPSSSAQKRPRAKRCDSQSAPTTSPSAAMRSSTSRPCSIARDASRSGRGTPRRHRALRTQGQPRLGLPRACDREPPWTSADVLEDVTRRDGHARPTGKATTEGSGDPATAPFA